MASNPSSKSVPIPVYIKHEYWSHPNLRETGHSLSQDPEAFPISTEILQLQENEFPRRKVPSLQTPKSPLKKVYVQWNGNTPFLLFPRQLKLGLRSLLLAKTRRESFGLCRGIGLPRILGFLASANIHGFFNKKNDESRHFGPVKLYGETGDRFYLGKPLIARCSLFGMNKIKPFLT